MAATTDITTLSVIIPVYNEVRTIATVIARVNAVDVHGLRKDIVVVDDGSTDGTREVLRALRDDGHARVIQQPANKGKGAAVRAGLEGVTGELVIIQDADLELSPDEYPRLVSPFLDDPATQAVFGSRFLAGSPGGRPLAVFANRFLTGLTNLLYDAGLSDMETCYKLCRTDVLKALDLQSDRFEIEPEITAKLLRRGCAIREVAVSYRPRSRADGKTINWRDGVRAIMTLIKWRAARKV
ncbi:MAG: glycosyltransferase family 2 protein [Acidobacteria bacterium]|nr:glycosyltransferase family 2 protein [Acidobacteriota bacterium]